MAGNQRTQPEIKGVLTRVSADLAHEPQQQNSAQPPLAYYTVRVALPLAEVARLKEIRLLPGMPAEAFIQTHDHTPLQYLLKPLQEQIALQHFSRAMIKSLDVSQWAPAKNLAFFAPPRRPTGLVLRIRSQSQQFEYLIVNQFCGD